jgi:hypothetical protein
MERMGTTCGNGHSFEGAEKGGQCPVCGSRGRIVHGAAAAAVATAPVKVPTVVVEGWRDLYEWHGEWFVAAMLVSLASTLVAHVFLSGWVMLLAAPVAAAAAWTLRRREFRKKRVRVVERH